MKALEINCRNHKHFDEVSFKEDLKTVFSINDIQTYKDIEEIIIYYEHARLPCTFKINAKILRANKRNDKRFNNPAYSLFFLIAILLKHL